jgi:hypothetical protein
MHIQLMQTFLARAHARLRADFSDLAKRKYFESSVRFGELLTDFLTCIDSSLSTPLDFVQLSAIVENFRPVISQLNNIDPAHTFETDAIPSQSGRSASVQPSQSVNDVSSLKDGHCDSH